MNKKIIYKILPVLIFSIYLFGCSGSEEVPEENNKPIKKDTTSIKNDNEIKVDISGNEIIKTALLEQNNKMYSPSVDSTYLYWLKNRLIILNNSTKCNIFVLNTLFKAGYKTPKTNALSRDLYNNDLFLDIMPFVEIKDLSEIQKGDIIIWSGHVIIFEELIYKKDKPYAKAVWAGTSQSDNGTNITNNVIHGNFPLKGDFKVRRPQKIVN